MIMDKMKVRENSLEKGIREYRSAAETMERVKIVIDTSMYIQLFSVPVLNDLEELRERVEELQAKFRRAVLWRRKELTRLMVSKKDKDALRAEMSQN